MHKAQLRKETLIKRKSFASPSLSATICQCAASLPFFKDAKTVMVYLSSKNEVDTSRLIALSHSLGKKLCAPRVINDTEMDAVLFDETGFHRGAFGIWEPSGQIADSIDLIFVPGVVFDKKGNRIGYGKGFYDRFLRKVQAVTVGLAYSCQIVSEIPAGPHDIQLDKILTEEGIIT